MKNNVAYLKKELSNNKADIVLLTAISVVIGLMGLIIPAYMKYFTDEILLKEKWDKLLYATAIFVGVIVIRYVIDLLYEIRLSHVTYNKITKGKRDELAQKIVRIHPAYLLKKNRQLMETDVESIITMDADKYRGLLGQTIKFITEVLKLVVYLILIFYYSIPIGILSVLRIPIYFIMVRIFDEPLNKYNEDARKSRSALVQKVKKIFASVLAIKSLGIESKVIEDAKTAVKEYTYKQRKIDICDAVYDEINIAINTLFSIISITICGYAIYKGNMTIGTMMLVQNVQSRTTMPLFFFNSYYLQYKNSFPSISRVVKLLETQQEENEIESDVEFSMITFENITYAYDDENNVLEDFNMQISRGDKLIITGDNMSGKSTLLKIIAGIIEPDSGRIIIDNKTVKDMAKLRALSTLFFQNQEFYAYFDTKGSGGEIALKNLEIVDRYKNKILLLDEPDANLDEERMKKVEELFMGKETAIMVTHKAAEYYKEKYDNVRILSI
ncbi:MAG: ABC transporter ATP-binding protein/permease [Lachnospiraceae bacterium]|nr:ABC transporter ATP-binding protein/permease [Lachnospiraceae bacterium]